MSTTVNHPGGSSQGYPSYYSGQQQQQQQQQAHQHQHQQHARKSSSRHGLFQSHNMPSLSTSHSPPGTFPPGTVITCGNHTCTVEKYLSEGGFAHVYLVKLAQIVDGTNLAVLKRVAVPDKEALSNMRTEVETMKRLKGHRHIVKYIDSHASHLQGSGYEVFLLMEFCSGGGLIDFMNTRLQNRLTEPEVLKIFTDIAEAVACMHYLEPPLLHRDLKIENILIQPNPRRYKLCDFGSSAPVTPAGKSVIECRALEEDIQKHTTMQYRSPEMIDVFKGLPIDEKSDIWALGVLLYKLCYYTTPFEGQGQLAILNASFKYPDYPKFSSALKNLIGSMLLEKPKDRPNIYEVLRQACKLRGVDCPIKDIYTGRRPSPVKQLQESNRSTVATAQPPKASKTQFQHTPQQQQQPQQQAYPAPIATSQNYDIAEIPQMRRGRPPKSINYTSQEPAKASTQAPKSSSHHSAHREPVMNDPFAALDKSSIPTDELSHKFPSVEQFSLAYDSGKKIDFSITSPTSAKLLDLPNFVDGDFNTSDFDTPSTGGLRDGMASEKDKGIAVPAGRYHPHSTEMLPRSPNKSSASSLPSKAPTMMRMPSGEGSTRPPGGHEQAMALKAKSQEQIHRSLGPAPLSSTISLPSPTSSLMSPPSDIGSHYSSGHRPKTTHIESNLDFLRNLDSSGRPSGSMTGAGTIDSASTGRSSPSQMEFIESNVDFLRALQHEADSARTIKAEKRHSSSKHSKRSSVPSASIANAKNLLAGRFGEAFKKFENNDGGDGLGDDQDEAKERGSWEVTTHDIPHEMKREMEKRQLAEEDRRVELAAAEYKRNIANAQKRPSGRADMIQRQVVESLQDDDNHMMQARSSVSRGKQMSSVSGPASSQPYTMMTSSSSSASSSSHKNQRNQTAELARHMERLDVAPSPHFRPQSAQGLMSSHLPERGSSMRSSHARPLPDRQHSSTAAPIMPGRQRPSVRERSGPPKPAPKPDKLRSMTPANDSIYMRSSHRSVNPHHRVALRNQQQQLRGIIPEADRLSTSPDKANYPLSSAVGSSEVDSIDMFKKRFPSL